MRIRTRLLDRIVLLAAVVAAGCVPSFIVQYRQRAGGRLDQVLADLAPFQAIADRNHGGSLAELIHYHLQSTDATFHQEGAALQSMVETADAVARDCWRRSTAICCTSRVSAAAPRHCRCVRSPGTATSRLYPGAAECRVCAGGRRVAVAAVSRAVARCGPTGARPARSAVARATAPTAGPSAASRGTEAALTWRRKVCQPRGAARQRGR